MGIIGTLLIILGIVLYMLRKRMRSMARLGLLKYWLEFHIFLCTLGPILVLYHTSFKFGGLVAISFWSMVAVFLSGIIGRFIYLQIPRSIEGRELSLSEVRDMKSNIGAVLSGSYNMDEESTNVIIESTRKKVELFHKNLLVRIFRRSMNDRRAIRRVKSVMKSNHLVRKESSKILKLVKHEISLNRRIDRLLTMQKLFRYWHVAHFPFAIVMLLIMAIHVAVTVILGYRWIF
jgi:preprotein translocase subunit Sec61beta